jgi:hypothetical protein
VVCAKILNIEHRRKNSEDWGWFLQGTACAGRLLLTGGTGHRNDDMEKAQGTRDEGQVE